MVGSLSAGLLLADEAGAHLPSVDDFLPPEILFQGTPFAINRIILIRIVATIVLLVVLGVTAKRAKLIPGRWQGVVEYGLDFVRDKVVYDVMGEARGKRYVPMITTLFITIFFKCLFPRFFIIFIIHSSRLLTYTNNHFTITYQ